MAKKAKRKKPVVQDVEVIVEEADFDEPDFDEPDVEDQQTDDNGLTYTKRYTLGVFNPSKSDVGHKVYDMFYETNVLKDAKREAAKVLKEDDLTVAIWDSDGMCNPPILFEPKEVKEDDDGEPTQTEPEKKHARGKASASEDEPVRPKPKRQRSSGSSGEPEPAEPRPRPKHPRRKKLRKS